jgi:putative NADH-flavin reductase
MKIALVAATGKIGRQIAQQAIARGHEVTAVVRRDTDLPPELVGARLVIAPLDDHDALVAAIHGNDVLASAYGPAPGAEATLSEIADDLIAAARDAGIRRLIVVGGAGSLELADGVQLVDTPDFPAAYKPVALAHRDALKRYRTADDLDWTFYSPAAQIGPGEKRGVFRSQANAFLADADGNSAISYADYADAFVGEIEQPKYPKNIATVAY